MNIQAFNWLGAWLLFILLLYLIMQTKAGYTFFYYLVWTSVIFLIVSHYQQITGILQAGGIVPSSQTGA